MRLDKFLVDCGVGVGLRVTASQAEINCSEWKKRDKAGKLQIDPDKDQVPLWGKSGPVET